MTSIKIYSKEQVDTLLSGKASSADIPAVVQGTGSSTADVMSQNAVTTALASKADSSTVPHITISTADPSGGNDGDIWLKYTA